MTRWHVRALLELPEKTLCGCSVSTVWNFSGMSGGGGGGVVNCKFEWWPKKEEGESEPDAFSKIPQSHQCCKKATSELLDSKSRSWPFSVFFLRIYFLDRVFYSGLRGCLAWCSHNFAASQLVSTIKRVIPAGFRKSFSVHCLIELTKGHHKPFLDTYALNVYVRLLKCAIAQKNA